MKVSVKESWKSIILWPLEVLTIWLVYEHIILSKFPNLPHINYGEWFLIFFAIGCLLSPGYWGILARICDKLYENKKDDSPKT